MNKPLPRRLAVLVGLLVAASLAGCDPWPSDVPKPSDPERNVPKRKALPDTKVPDGMTPASVPTQ